jgi:transcriptional regulator with XRE-family HTH domain
MNKADRKTLIDFGKTVRELRRDKGLSIAQLAAKSGMEASHLQGCERGTYDPSLTDMTNIARGLGMEVGLFIMNSADTLRRLRQATRPVRRRK